jgi:hypothetical protein
VPKEKCAQQDEQTHSNLPEVAEGGLGEDPAEHRRGKRVAEGFSADEDGLGAQPSEGREEREREHPLRKPEEPPLEFVGLLAPDLGASEGWPRHQEVEGAESDEQGKAPYVDEAHEGKKDGHARPFANVEWTDTRAPRGVTAPPGT